MIHLPSTTPGLSGVATGADGGGAGRARLMDVLARTMIRASKADVQGRLLQPCTKSVVRLPFDAEHQACYNVLIEVRSTSALLSRELC